MFRIQGLPERDSVEERRRTREGVISNIIVFASLVAILRAMPFILKKI